MQPPGAERAARDADEVADLLRMLAPADRCGVAAGPRGRAETGSRLAVRSRAVPTGDSRAGRQDRPVGGDRGCRPTARCTWAPRSPSGCHRPSWSRERRPFGRARRLARARTDPSPSRRLRPASDSARPSSGRRWDPAGRAWAGGRGRVPAAGGRGRVLRRRSPAASCAAARSRPYVLRSSQCRRRTMRASFPDGSPSVARPAAGRGTVCSGARAAERYPLPASATRRRLVLPARVTDFSPAMLDEGARSGRGPSGWAVAPRGRRRLALSFHLADSAPHAAVARAGDLSRSVTTMPS